MALELRQLRLVLALAQHGSIGRAAAALHMTQPALSRSLKQIEYEVGKALFERSSTGVKPTDHGHLLLRRAGELVEAADALDREVLLRRVSGLGQLNIGCGPHPGESMVPDAVTRFMKDEPLVSVRVLCSGDWEDMVRRIRAHELEMVIAEFSTLTDQHDLDIEVLQPHQVYFMARAGHPLAAKAAVKLEEMFAFPFVAFSRLPPRVLQPMLAARLPAVGRQPGYPFPAIECSTIENAKRIVARSNAICALMLCNAAEELERGQLVVLGTQAWSYANYGVVSLKGQAPTAAAVRFRTCMHAAEADLAQREIALAATHLRRLHGRTRR